MNSLLDKSEPVIVNTRRGPVEYAAHGEGPAAVLALHGAMGGYDQGPATDS
jgi:hypothetical protein